ncbi:hypothetical protein [Desulfosporosinus sp. Sb-LF]|nr:hypothetical protein [Desulfosporosinus sp. Sb-LF]
MKKAKITVKVIVKNDLSNNAFRDFVELIVSFAEKRIENNAKKIIS